MSRQLGDKQATFKQFPEFSKLRFADKSAYEALIANFPPIYDISFSALMTWWNPLGDISISRLNDNLVIPYWLPGDAKHSGLSLVGTNNIDESICTIFDHLKAQGNPPRLINVPEFVLNSVRFPELFRFKEERRYDEYVIPIEQFYPLKNMTAHRRQKVEKQLRMFSDKQLKVRVLDLHMQENKRLLLAATQKWQSRSINNYGKLEADALKDALEHSEILEIDNVCLFIDDELYGYCLYETARDKRYVDVKHIKATHASVLRFELIGYLFAQWFAEHGYQYANISADFGLLRLRMFMLTLGASHFFRKYSVEPA